MRVIAAGCILAHLLRRLVHRMLDMLALDPARLAPEGQEHQPPAVEAGQQRGDRAHPEGEVAHIVTARERDFEDRVLRMEARETRMEPVDADAGYRQRTRHHRPEGERDMLPDRKSTRLNS